MRFCWEPNGEMRDLQSTYSKGKGCIRGVIRYSKSTSFSRCIVSITRVYLLNYCTSHTLSISNTSPTDSPPTPSTYPTTIPPLPSLSILLTPTLPTPSTHPISIRSSSTIRLERRTLLYGVFSVVSKSASQPAPSRGIRTQGIRKEANTHDKLNIVY